MERNNIEDSYDSVGLQEAEVKTSKKREIPWDKLSREQKLNILAEIESTFFVDFNDALRPDFLENDVTGNPRNEDEKNWFRFIWQSVCDLILPSLYFTEPTPEGQLRETEWLLIFGPTGTAKTTLSVYYVFWVLEQCPWIETIHSTTPIFAYSLSYPFVLRDSSGNRVLHPKYVPQETLREIESYRNCLWFADELASLLPGRNAMDRRQFIIATAARNFRKENVFVIANAQREMSPDPELRENFDCLIQPELLEDKTVLIWKLWRNNDADYSIYHESLFHNETPIILPANDPENFPVPILPWLFLAFDSRHKVQFLFQQPLNDETATIEAKSVYKWLEEKDNGGIYSNYYSRDKLPPDHDLNAAIRSWDVSNEKMYSKPELLLITQEFKRIFHKLSEEPSAPPVSMSIPVEPVKEKSPVVFRCQCGYETLSESDFLSHQITVKNSILGLVRASKATVEKLRQSHTNLLQESSQ